MSKPSPGPERVGGEAILFQAAKGLAGIRLDDSAAAPEEITSRVHRGLAALPSVLRELLEVRYGIADGTRWTLQTTARVFKMSEAQVRRIETQALAALARAL